MGVVMQPQGYGQGLCNTINFGMNVQETGNDARSRYSDSSEAVGTRLTDGDQLALESNIDPHARFNRAKKGQQLH